ncbi:hypothetical protein SEA_CECE_276 [Microbacterium phage Cece]|nr:hypothetical protein SEA_CECE_276 [Microbacterium phage Cece]
MTLYRLIRNQTHVYEVEASSPEEASTIVGTSNPIGLVSSWDRWQPPVEATESASREEAERLVQMWRDGFPEANAALQRYLSQNATEKRDIAQALRVGAIEQADAYLSTHRKTEVWSLINRLRDELVRA